jgi:hypothetical protein
MADFSAVGACFGSNPTCLKSVPTKDGEPRRVCRRLQPLRGWSDDDEEDGGELLA